ncbi:MAG: peptidoglycan binding domain-containing protein, partial [Candidatus Aphodocola sp.]
MNNKDTKIKKGVSIEGIDVSELSKEEAKNKIQTEFLDKLDETIYFQYGENLYSLALEQLNVDYKLDEAVDKAYNVAREGSIIQRDLKVISLKKKPVNITIDVTYDEVTLDACILDISAKLPEQVEQPSYYIEDGELIITSGKIGKAALSDETKKIVEDALNNKNYNDVYYDIPTYDKYPEKIDVEKIHSEIYKEAQDAYFTTEPRMVYADETGVDFVESVET